MKENFGSDAFFIRLKDAFERQDAESARSLLLPKMISTCNSILFRESEFSSDTPENKQLAMQNAMEEMEEKIGHFLLDPRNDPTALEEARFSPAQRQSWFRMQLRNSIRHTLDKARRYPVQSYDAPGNGDRPSPADTLASGEPTPEEKVLRREGMSEVLTAFFSLKNAPETVAAVGFIILTGALDNRKFSMEEYSRMLSGRKALEVVGHLERLLVRWELDPGVLMPLKERLPKEAVMPELSAQKLANIKNRMLTAMRARPAQEDGRQERKGDSRYG